MDRCLVLFVVGVALAASMLNGCAATRASDAGRCARLWNEDPAEDVSDRFDEAIVYRWTDKADDEGCGVIFLSGNGNPWIIFGSVVRGGGVTRWDRVSGDRWGEDSPEGGPGEPNAAVLDGGLLSVPT